MVLAAPTVPFSAPPNNLQRVASVKDDENAIPHIDIAVLSKPMRSTFLRPTVGLSATRPHRIEVTTWVAVKAPCNTPACREMTDSEAVGSKERS
jgi:hypothetical protein